MSECGSFKSEGFEVLNSPFLGERGLLRQLRWWRGRREPLKKEGSIV